MKINTYPHPRSIHGIFDDIENEKYIEYGYPDRFNNVIIKHREGDLPAFISDTKVAWYEHDIHTRKGNMPSTIYKYMDRLLHLYFDSNGRKNDIGPTFVMANLHPIFDWYMNDNLTISRPVERYDIISVSYVTNGISITNEVERWIRENNIPRDYQDWNDHHRLLYKLTFG